MRKMTLYGKDARDKIFQGVQKIVAAVKVTLGPNGRNVLISQSMVEDYGVHALPINITKDGYHTATAFDLDDPFEKAGVLIVKESAQKTVDQAGDGTSTTSILLEAIVAEGLKRIDAGENPMELKRTIDKEVSVFVDALKNISEKIGDDNEKIFNIATISANNDPEIGRMIADAYKRIGHEGMIDIEAGKSVQTDIKISKGYRFEQSWVSNYFVNNREKQICEFENPLILLYEKRIIHHTQVQRALELAIGQTRPILIICEDSTEEGLGFMVANVIQKRVQCCVVKSPSFGELRKQEMEDIAILTGGTYISDSRGTGIKEIEFENFGQATKVIVTKEETTIIGGKSDTGALNNLLNELRMNLAQAKNEDEKAPIEKRIAKLIGGVAVIQVGAATETEMKEKLDRFDDSVRAVRAAISEGYVAGGGTTFLRLMPEYGIIKEALKSPLIQICLNAGVDSNDIMDRVLSSTGNIGYNAKTDKMEDLVEAGVIDPAKVIRCSLQNAASSAGMLLTTEVLIADTL